MPDQWPPATARVAKYICENLGVDPYGTFLFQLEKACPIRIAADVHTVNIGPCRVPIALTGAELPCVIARDGLVALALHCICYYSVTNAASWARATTMAHPGAFFPAAVWAHLAYMHVWPREVGIAHSAARPDIRAWCRAAYHDWLQLCRSPRAIGAALQLAAGLTWDVKTPTTAATVFAELVHKLQIAVIPTTRRGTPDITINGGANLSVAPVDKILLGFVMLRGKDKILFSPIVGNRVRTDVPHAFAPQDVLIDDLRIVHPQ